MEIIRNDKSSPEAASIESDSDPRAENLYACHKHPNEPDDDGILSFGTIESKSVASNVVIKEWEDRLHELHCFDTYHIIVKELHDENVLQVHLFAKVFDGHINAHEHLKWFLYVTCDAEKDYRTEMFATTLREQAS